MTPRQEKFARAFIETGNASEAYRQAYNIGKRKPETITNDAYKLLKKPDIVAMIDSLKAEHRERHNMTVDDILQELEEARQIAKQDNKAAPMVAATMGKAKVLGLIIDKQELKTIEPPKIVVELTAAE